MLNILRYIKLELDYQKVVRGIIQPCSACAVCNFYERPTMAKRYHNSVSQGDYAGYAARNRMEGQDSDMIHEDHSAIANMPQNVMIKAWPVVSNYLPEGLNDTISGIDRQMELDNSKRRAHNVPKKV